MRIVCVLVLSALTCSVVWQTEADALERGASVRGMIVDGKSGQPLGRATCYLLSFSQGPKEVVSDESGSFSFSDLEPGRYVVRAVSEGYYLTDDDGRSGGVGKELAIRPGQQLRGIVLRLLPRPSLIGRVTDEENRPLANVYVVALQFVFRAAKRRLIPRGGNTWTNALGEFRLDGVLPGHSYYVLALPGLNLGADSDEPPDEDVNQGYVPAFLPGFEEVELAAAVEVPLDGSSVERNIRLRQVRGVTVKGKVQKPAGKAVDWETEGMPRPKVILRPRIFPAMVVSPNTQVLNAEGDFEIRGVVPESYLLTAQWRPADIKYFAQTPLEVRDAHIDDAYLVLKPGVTLRVLAKKQGDDELDCARLFVSLVPAGDETLLSRHSEAQHLNTACESRLEDLKRGIYDVSLKGELEGFYVKSAWFEGVEVRDYTLDLTRGSSSPVFELLLNPNEGTVAGRVVDTDGEPAAGALVILVPQPWNQRPSHLYKVAAADQRGAFILRGIAPGKYKVFGLEGVALWAWESLDLPLLFGSGGNSVEIQEGASVPIELEARSVRE